MEEEMNYLSKRIEELEQKLGSVDIGQQGSVMNEYSRKLTSLLTEELELLENIVSFITIKTLSEIDEN